MANVTVQRDGTSNYANIKDATPSNPAANATTSLVFAGLAIAFTPHKFDGQTTPNDTTSSLKVKVTMDAKNSVSGDGVQVQVLFGTGTAPTNGTAAPGSGTQIGKTRQGTSSAANVVFELVIDTVAKSLFTLNTAYWFDLAFAATTAGTATLTNIEFIIEEI